MRISPLQVESIVDAVHRYIDDKAQVWLFGSRCNDDAKGGDIDLYIESDELSTPFLRRIQLKIAIEEAIGEQKVDVVYHNKNYPLKPIHKIAKLEGVRLN